MRSRHGRRRPTGSLGRPDVPLLSASQDPLVHRLPRPVELVGLPALPPPPPLPPPLMMTAGVELGGDEWKENREAKAGTGM